MSNRWLILTICLDRDGDAITASENTSGARSQGPTVPEAMLLLGHDIEARYHALAALPRPWPHQQRARDDLARFFKEPA